MYQGKSLTESNLGHTLQMGVFGKDSPGRCLKTKMRIPPEM